jgi:hypothetical protein
MAAIRELGVRNDLKRRSFKNKKKMILFFSLLCTGIFIVVFFRFVFFNQNTILNLPPSPILAPDSKPVHTPDKAPAKAPVKTQVKTQTKPPPKASVKAQARATHKTQSNSLIIKDPRTVMGPYRDLGGVLEKLDRRYSRKVALKVTMDLWGTESKMSRDLDGISDDYEFFRLAAEQNSLLIRRIKGHFNAVKKLNLPAVLAFNLPGDHAPVYLALYGINDEKITLRAENKDISIELEPDDLESYWLGVAYIPWKNFLSLKGTIPLDSPKHSIITLKRLLRDIGFNTVEISPFYDKNTRKAVKMVQGKYRINMDGIVGSTTKIALYNEKKFKDIPHISTVSGSNAP